MTTSTIASTTLDMSQTAVYHIPGLTGIVQQAAFNDYDLDGAYEILVSDGHTIALYSAADNALTFALTVDTRAVNHAILYDDVNRDHIPDILVGYYFEYGAFKIDTVCRVEVYDGAAGYVSAESLYFEADIDFAIGTQSPSSFVALDCFDVTGDGYNELFFSFDRCRLTSLTNNDLQITTGQTSLYNDFPGTIDFSRNALLRDIQTVELSTGERLLLGTRYDNLTVIPDKSRAAAWLEVISAGGDSLGSVGEPIVSLCSGDSTSLVSALELLCAGDIHPGSADPDILVRYHWQQTCYESDEVVFDQSDTSLRLYRLGGPGDIELLWSDLTPVTVSNFYYSSDYPGSYFGASNGVIYRMSGLDGEEVDSSEPIDADTIIWRSDANLTHGDFVAIKDQTLTVYELDTSTDTPDGNQTVSSPARFTLSNPRPNPFNSSCVIAYTVPYRARTVITVHNILGQEIATLVNEVKSAGSHTVAWNGTDHSGNTVASGIYLYRMTAGDYVDSKKAVLIK